MRLKLISCEVFHREMMACIERSPNTIEITFLPKGLHEHPAAAMRSTIQQEINSIVDGTFDAIILGYGLCSYGISGLRARSIPLIVARAHDCITVLLGSLRRHEEYFQKQPGTYYLTSGWIERGKHSDDELSIQHAFWKERSFEALSKKYGEDNARFLIEEMNKQTQHYRQCTFIEMGVEPDDRFERRAREEATRWSWNFEKVSGDLSLIQRMLDGVWDDKEFLIVPPGHTIVPDYHGGVIAAKKEDQG